MTKHEQLINLRERVKDLERGAASMADRQDLIAKRVSALEAPTVAEPKQDAETTLTVLSSGECPFNISTDGVFPLCAISDNAGLRECNFFDTDKAPSWCDMRKGAVVVRFGVKS